MGTFFSNSFAGKTFPFKICCKCLYLSFLSFFISTSEYVQLRPYSHIKKHVRYKSGPWQLGVYIILFKNLHYNSSEQYNKNHSAIFLTSFFVSQNVCPGTSDEMVLIISVCSQNLSKRLYCVYKLTSMKYIQKKVGCK